MGGSESEPANVIAEKGKQSLHYDENIDREITAEVKTFFFFGAVCAILFCFRTSI